MNIIIPIGGKGERFKNKDYVYPKPLIFSKGKRILFWLLESLNTTKDDTIFIIYRKEFENFQFENIIKFNFPTKNIKFLNLSNDTNGPVETISFVLKSMTEDELSELTLIVDSDTFCEEDIITKSKIISDNFIFYGKNDSEDPIYSYIGIDDKKNVINIKEKIKISDNICIGSYCFKSAHFLNSKIHNLLQNKSEKEIYISAIYNLLLEEKISVKSEYVDKFHCMGTPTQLEVFSSNFIDNKKYRICFDLDNTLVTYPEQFGDYSTVKPIQSNIDFLNFLYDLGHTIIIHTARRMKTHHGDVELVKKDIEKVTLETLKKFKINYHEIIFGKPYANFYIDDLSINPGFNLEKQLGFYNVHPESRFFNSLEKLDNSIIKKSSLIEGELYYYNNIPKVLKKYFPKLLNYSSEFIEIEKIDGLTISFLNVNENLDEKILLKILNTLEVIHSYKNVDEDLDIYGNYSNKLRKRFDLIDYSSFSNSDNIIRDTLNYLSTYESQKRGLLGMIHGDPVFSNIILTNEEKLKFIDMRGKIDSKLTIFGDIFYDYSKVYQSIIGYDFVLYNKELNIEKIKKNKLTFENYIISHFGENRLSDIKYITKSLLLSLLPLHQDIEKRKKYFDLIGNL